MSGADRIGCDAAGDEDAHSVLLVSGPSGASAWATVRAKLSSRGLSVQHAPASRVADAVTIADTLDARSARPAVVVGHGPGAGAALALAATAPHRVLAVVLVAPLRTRRPPADVAWRVPLLRRYVLTRWLGAGTIAGIACPVVVLAGTGAAAELARRLPEARLVSCPAGHRALVEDPECVADAVLGALRWQYRNALHRR
jgi:pimeloyl-ACP methyl ester carboxylesterase